MIVGILLAAGSGTRFGAHKLLHPLPDGTPMAVAALRNLAQGVDEVIVVVRPGDTELMQCLAQEKVQVMPCAKAGQGMGASLACGVRAAPDAAGWIIALADMPFVPGEIVTTLAARLKAGDAIVAPAYLGQRGHPVGFGHAFYPALSALNADQGARHILKQQPDRLTLIPCTDPGVLRDIDTQADLNRP
ncbi:MAG TPA: nucleotidyltransferase family protein [Thiobacillus sp.]|nr:nucleotidyltransferase family protein [Thiobacillus sp.]